MSGFGIDAMVVCPVSREFLSLTADAFFQSLVVKRLQARAMVEGPNFYFGRNREGDVHKLRQLCESHQIALQITESSEISGEMVSSTRIRSLLECGMIAEAVNLLGAPYRIRGRVAAGARRGRTLGFPTANLTGIDVMIPGPGVYGGYVELAKQSHVAAVHIGPNPTFDSVESSKVEIHLLDYDGDLYGQTLLVDVVLRVRDIARFDSAQSLVGQLNRDIEFIRTRLSSLRRS
jgi:riboflavin kinase/FMN adenylyltransferase